MRRCSRVSPKLELGGSEQENATQNIASLGVVGLFFRELLQHDLGHLRIRQLAAEENPWF